MTGRFILFILFYCGQIGFAQKPLKKDLYLYFTPDSINYKYSIQQNPGPIKGESYPDEADIYGTTYKSKDGAKKIKNSYFTSINKNRYRITDSIEFISLKAIPYANLPNMKGVGIDTSDKLHFPYRNVYVIEKVTNNQFKIVQVHTYIGSNKVTYSPGINM